MHLHPGYVSCRHPKPPANVLEITEEGIPIHLRLSVTRNFGCQIQNGNHAPVVTQFLESEFSKHLEEETRINRCKRPDHRVHVAIYFLRPTSRGLTAFDIQAMQMLCTRVNLIPVIAKADLLTKDELDLNKRLIWNHLMEHHIEVFDFGLAEDAGSDASSRNCDVADLLGNLRHPLAICAGGTTRILSHGQVDVFDAASSDFVPLRNLLLGSHIHELRELTMLEKYENFRVEQLGGDVSSRRAATAAATAAGAMTCTDALKTSPIANQVSPDQHQQINLQHHSLPMLIHASNLTSSRVALPPSSAAERRSPAESIPTGPS